MNKKSISPIIAVVLLITMTLTVASLLRVWYFSEQQQSQERTSKIIEKESQKIEEEINVENYDDTNSTLHLRNVGLTSIDTNSINIYEDGAPLSGYTFSSSTVPPGEAFTIYNISLTIGKTYRITTEVGYAEIFEYNVRSVFIYPEEESIFSNGGSTPVVGIVKDNFGNRVGSGIDVTFQTTLGIFSESGTSTYTTSTNPSGEATATLVSDTNTGRAKISALAGNYTSMTSVSIEYWWDSSWTKRKKIMIEENSGNDLTDYQIKMSVSYDSDMQPDYDDLRFVDSGGNLLDYWIETSNPANAVIWVKIPSIPESSTTTVYMYYGNALASSVSDGVVTFDWFDDFAGAHTITDYTIEDVGNTNTPSNWAINTVNGILYQHSNIYWNGNQRNIGSIIKTGVNLSNFEVMFKIKPVDNDTGGVCFDYVSQDNHYAFGFVVSDYWFGTSSTGSRREAYWQDSATTHQTLSYDTGSVSQSSVTSFIVRRYGDIIKVLQNGTEIFAVINSNLTSGDIGLFTNALDEAEFHPPFIIRKYIYPEPTYTIESEVSFT